MLDQDRTFLDIAVEEAMLGAQEGGIPVGAALAWRGRLISRGRNRRQQRQVVTLHGETDCITQAGLFGRWSETTLYTTLSPCMMCAGAVVQFRIARVVIADAVNYSVNEDFLRSRGVIVDVVNDGTMVAFFRDWIAANPGKWNSDVVGATPDHAA